MQPTDTERINLIREVFKALAAGELTEGAALVAIGTIVQEPRPLTEEEIAWGDEVADRFDNNC